jgi:hypothetical protein
MGRRVEIVNKKGGHVCTRVDGARVVATLYLALVVLVLVPWYGTRNSGRRIDTERKKYMEVN